MGRLPVFTRDQKKELSGDANKDKRKRQPAMNILDDPQIPLPVLDQQLEAKISGEINSGKFMELGRNMLPNIG